MKNGNTQMKVENSIFLTSKKQIEDISSLFVLRNPDEVRTFINDNDSLQEFLFDAHKEILKIFDENIEIFLEVCSDPEEEFQELFITVRTQLNSRQSVDLLDKFDNEFWLKVDPEIRKILEFDVESKRSISSKPWEPFDFNRVKYGLP